MQQESIHYRSLRERQRKEREELILKVAEEVLLQKGYHETSMDEIATRVGIAKGTLYLHFARKEDLVVALVRRELTAALQKLEEIAAGEGTAREKLETMLYFRGRGLLEKGSQLFFVLHNGMDIKPVLKEQSGPLRDILKRIIAIASDLLDQGKREGAFDATLPTAIMCHLLFGVLSPFAYRRLVEEEHIPPDEILRCTGKIFFKAIAAEPGDAANQALT
ncbi:MAG: helix-turn-helix transcriptional regulator [Ktedonobacteraceae bacterium]|nr:helix-turn-helix transcriptional regulator [Ktedonobacteraceae bacterium]